MTGANDADPDDVVPIDAAATRRRRLLGVALFIVLPIAFVAVTYGVYRAFQPRSVRIWMDPAR